MPEKTDCMIVSYTDWLIVGIYFLISLGIGLYMRRRAGRSTGDFFLGGRKLPWYIAGTSMVATTFAADTPLAVTELVAEGGISGNWLWWNMLFGGMLTVFFFARLWRRAGIMTDCEFVAIRYSGPQASFLRGFRAIYTGIFMNVIVIAWVNLAMVKILKVMFPELLFFGNEGIDVFGLFLSSHLLWVGALMLFVAVYSSLSGMWGISLTDTFQFVIAMAGCIVLAIVVVNQPEIGGLKGLRNALPAEYFSYFPVLGDAADGVNILKMSAVAMIAYLGVQWWASWYPGAEPGGGGYVAQRIMSAKNETHGLLATLWFQIAHFTIRPWPWIIAALAALVLYPDAPDKGATFVMLIRDYMPVGLMGLLLAAFFAAYMSTLASQTNWGTSYIINDLFRPFIKPNADEKYYVRVSRITTFVLLFFSLIVTTQFDKISDAWKFILSCSGGIGLVLILRWYWWRINAWSEIAAMLAPYAVYPILLAKGVSFETGLIIIVAWSSLVWIIVTFVTKPVSDEKLSAFYRKIHPGGPGWKPIALKNPDVVPDSGMKQWFINWLAGCVLVISFLFGTGYILFGYLLKGMVAWAFSAIALFIILRSLSRGGVFGAEGKRL